MNRKLIWTISIFAIFTGLLIGGASFRNHVATVQSADEPVVSDQITEKVNLYFFYGSTCPHCKKELKFLDIIEDKYPQVRINKYEVYGSTDNADLLLKFYEACGEEKAVIVPGTFIGEEVIVGYLNDETTGKKIESAIEYCLDNTCADPLDKVEVDACEACQCLEGEDCECEVCDCATEPENSDSIIPTIFGDIDISKMSLPVMTAVIGALDGFNPCAMWVLVLLIALLINTKSRKKMALVGGTFIVASGIVYFLILAAWLNLFLYIGYISITRIAIGVVSVVIGIWQIRSFMTFEPGVCKVTSKKEKWHKKMVEKIKEVTNPTSLPATFLGLIVLAFAVNFIEFFCSAGLPAIYTRVLSLSNLSPLSYYLYLILYVAFFMLDDAIIFTIAMVTLSKIGFTDKYSRWSTLIGGLIILALGLMLIFSPNLLMFA